MRSETSRHSQSGLNTGGRLTIHTGTALLAVLDPSLTVRMTSPELGSRNVTDGPVPPPLMSSACAGSVHCTASVSPLSGSVAVLVAVNTVVAYPRGPGSILNVGTGGLDWANPVPVPVVRRVPLTVIGALGPALDS